MKPVLRAMTWVLVCGWASSPRDAAAQILSLPELQSLNISAHWGGLLSSSQWDLDKRWCGSALCGWGFETLYNVGHNAENDETAKRTDEPSPWSAQLAVGYDHVPFQGTIEGTSGAYELFGSVRSLPSLSMYAIHDSGWYVGIGTGLTQLKDVRLYRKIGDPAKGQVNAVYGVSGDTFGLSVMVGYTSTVQLFGYQLYPFIEAAYRGRHFASLNYTLPSDVDVLPGDLPKSVTANGVIVSVGIEIRLR